MVVIPLLSVVLKWACPHLVIKDRVQCFFCSLTVSGRLVDKHFILEKKSLYLIWLLHTLPLT